MTEFQRIARGNPICSIFILKCELGWTQPCIISPLDFSSRLLSPAVRTTPGREDGIAIIHASAEVWPAVCSYSQSQYRQIIPWVCHRAEGTSETAIHRMAALLAPRNRRALHRRHHLLHGMQRVLHARSPQLANIIAGHWRSYRTRFSVHCGAG